MKVFIALATILCIEAVAFAGDAAPLVIEGIEKKYAADLAKAQSDLVRAESELSKARKIAENTRLKSYKDRLIEITKSGDFDKAQSVKARITELERSSETESTFKQSSPRPKDVVKFGGHTYAMIQEPATWHVAKRKCEEMGGHLACVETAEEETFLKSLCGQTPTWFGASDEEAEGTWIWCLNSAPVKLTIKADNHGGSEHHLAFFSNQWGDGNAGTRHAYICEWEK